VNFLDKKKISEFIFTVVNLSFCLYKIKLHVVIHK
jgi:hypothetical protein